MSAIENILDLDDPESFLFLFNSLWSAEAAERGEKREGGGGGGMNTSSNTIGRKGKQTNNNDNNILSPSPPSHVHLNIPDTILFSEGRPARWLFTSDTKGVR